ncbi:hypothetical protein NP493_64g05039 [Ridgeia piscesae]|uniref:Uncharacterized protein n=1 Tax=Ridgeia piscesae TaxID=27915 RepID=A0AAD9PA72_RIDPI|nr:hypothetical protein NP493_64g05039 [Ridgeia piscesae]
MKETDTSIYITNTQIENIKSYMYLGQRYSTRDKNQDKETERRITAGWTAFAKHRDIFKGNIGTCLKRQIYMSGNLSAYRNLIELDMYSDDNTSSHVIHVPHTHSNKQIKPHVHV